MTHSQTSHRFLCYIFLIGISHAALNCPPLPPHPAPSNVTQLRPGDIKVVLALGDSITAGFAIRGEKGGLNESRGLAAPMGGDPQAITLPNFLKFYSPNLQGASLGQHVVEICAGNICPPYQYHPTQDVLNGAQSGAMVENMVTHELNYIITQLKANPNINMKEDWKLLTIFIGANDLCAYCKDKTFLEPDQYEAEIIKTLEGIRANIPRVFVQIMEIFNLSQVYDLSLQSSYCQDIHRFLPIECPCIFDKNANATRLAVDVYAQLYNARTRAIAAQYQAYNYADFTVVAQPCARNTQLQSLPPSMLSTLDCFHPSLVAHEAFTVAFWNNLLSPASAKKTYIDIDDVPLCPTADTLLYVN